MSQSRESTIFKYLCTTQQSSTTFDYTWIINNFSFLRATKTTENLLSPVFPGNDANIKFNIGLYCTTKVNVRLFPSCSGHINNKCKVNFSISNNDSTLKTVYFSIPYFAIADLIKTEELLNTTNGLLTDDKLIICCQIIMLKGLVHKIERDYKMKVSACNLSEDLGVLLNSNEFNDLTIVTRDNQQIQAHKNILSARSVVFAAMFKHPLKENQLNSVTIDDFNHDVITEILTFIYTGKAPKLEDMVEDLLSAAEKYQLDRLKAMCVKSLSDNLSIETATITFILADLYNEKELKLECVKFIKKHALRVAETSNWQKLFETNRGLILESFTDPKLLELK